MAIPVDRQSDELNLLYACSTALAKWREYSWSEEASSHLLTLPHINTHVNGERPGTEGMCINIYAKDEASSLHKMLLRVFSLLC